jgi:lipoprotein NlpD
LIKKYPVFKYIKTNSDYFLFNVTLCICLLVALSACTSSEIYLNKKFNPPVYFGQHVVQPGDTLYRIAWRYGRELPELAEANNIKPPYVIVPGQKINLEKRAGQASKVQNTTTAAPTTDRNVTKRKETVSTGKSVTENKKHNNFKSINWAWPHLGPIIASYNSPSSENLNGLAKGLPNKGIDISGRVGDPIYAAADGEVVYAGSGLLGYGNLVIINHSEQYLSAYAHNRKILVEEGQIIKTGQIIAEMGSSESQKTKLHFEIRRNGQPVDPLHYLPKRK